MPEPFFKVPLSKRLLSYLVPVRIAQEQGKQHSFLEFLLYRGQWQLATEEALYSDGYRYLPFRLAFRNLSREKLRNINHCLVLGTGLGSIVEILSKKYGCNPYYSLVEYDETILKRAIEYLSAKGIKHMRPYCMDAELFVRQQRGHYDLICVNIFNDLQVPENFLEKEFLHASREILEPGGIWIMNYIVHNQEAYKAFRAKVQEVFPQVRIVCRKRNRLFIATGKQTQ